MSGRVRDVLLVVLGLLVVAGGGWLAAGGTATWETELFAEVNRRPVGALTPALLVVMQAGALGAVPVAAGLAWLLGHSRLGRRLAVAGATAWLAAKGVKALVGRGRPADLLTEVVLRSGETGGLGYPSGHVTVAAALFTVAAPALPRRWRLVGWGVVAVVGFARMYVGVHLPGDLLGGIGLGAALGAGVRLLTPARARDGGLGYEDGRVRKASQGPRPDAGGGRRPRG